MNDRPRSGAASLLDDDLSTSFGRTRTRLVGVDGRSYGEVRSGLSPRWWLVAFDLGATWIFLAGVVAILVWVQGAGWWGSVVAVIVGALLVGAGVHRVNLFLHEGAHVNLAPRRWNDLVTNVVAGTLVLGDVRSYRPLHMAHHRNLGTTRDPERTYFSRLDAAFLVRCGLGLHVVAVLRNRGDAITRQTSTGETMAGETMAGESEAPAMDGVTAAGQVRLIPWPVLAGVVGHAAVVITAVATGHWVLAAAWTIGVVSVFPLLTSIRQLAEHRSPEADGSTDYSSVDMGAHTRMFDRAPMRWLFGAAGFDHHLLHHWDPKVSYTRLRELRAWLSETDVGPVVERRESNYARTLRSLWRR